MNAWVWVACFLLAGFVLADRIARHLIVTAAERITRDHAPSSG